MLQNDTLVLIMHNTDLGFNYWPLLNVLQGTCCYLDQLEN